MILEVLKPKPFRYMRPVLIFAQKQQNMKFVAEIDIMPHKELLDPQGKAVSHSLHNMGLNAVQDVRIGKHVKLSLDATTEEEARKEVEAACKQLLANAVMESYSYTLHSN